MMSHVMTFDCAEAGGFKSLQCFKDEFSCVRPNGEEMTTRVVVRPVPNRAEESRESAELDCGE